MISFEDFVMEPGVPIYLQILRYIKRGVAAGTIRDGDELPSRRVLSALLGVNPNTVQKAYRVLEEEALIESHTGARSYMVLDARTTRRSFWRTTYSRSFRRCGRWAWKSRMRSRWWKRSGSGEGRNETTFVNLDADGQKHDL